MRFNGVLCWVKPRYFLKRKVYVTVIKNLQDPTFLKLKKLLDEEIVPRFLSLELEDFDLDSTAIFSLENIQGQYNQESANMLLGIYEVVTNIKSVNKMAGKRC